MKPIYKFGMGVSVSTAGSAIGSAKAEVVIAAVVLDECGNIADMVTDAAEIRIPVAGGVVAGTDRTTVFKTRYENRNFQGESSRSALWCRQADAFRLAVLGRKQEEIEKMEQVEDGSGYMSAIKNSEDMSALKTAVVKACRDSKENTFTVSDYRLGLAVFSRVDHSTRSASGEHPGCACLFSSFAAVVMGNDGRILEMLADEVQPQIIFNQKGIIGETIYEGSLRETKDNDWTRALAAEIVGYTSEEISARDCVVCQAYPIYRKLAEKASLCRSHVLVNSISYKAGEMVRIPVTDIKNDRFVAIKTDDNIVYRMLTEKEQKAGEVWVAASSDMSVKFYCYGFYIDDRCVIAGDTNRNRILLSDYLPEGYENYYCFGYDSNSGSIDTDGVGCMCATNDLWKVFHVRYVYTGYYQVGIAAAPDKEIIMLNAEKAYKADPIPAGAVFPFCDADNPVHLKPAEGGRKIKAGTYYVKRGTVFTDGITSYEITENTELRFV